MPRLAREHYAKQVAAAHPPEENTMANRPYKAAADPLAVAESARVIARSASPA